MSYAKPPLTFEQQADLLIQRGMTGDRDLMVTRLASVNYYRLICKYCLGRIAPQSQWARRVRTLLADFPRIPVAEMGFPPDWERCPIWSSSGASAQGGHGYGG